jgi:DNA/RNA endonuclease G (NUC1)
MLPRPLCFSAFAVLHSGKSRTPIYVAERLNRALFLDARDGQRTNEFFADARVYVMRASGDVFVITGPVFDSNPPTIGSPRVWVPQHLFKLVYDPSTNRAWAHWLDNRDDATPGRPLNYEELVRRTGIEFLPGMK